MNKYPTRNGIAVPVWELSLPESYDRKENNHHNEWSAKRMGRLAVTQSLRDLERHQYILPVDTHKWLHDTYDPPEMPSEEQAAREVIDAYAKGEMFKIYNRRCHWYELKDIPQELVDGLVAKYSLVRVFDMAAD